MFYVSLFGSVIVFLLLGKNAYFFFLIFYLRVNQLITVGRLLLPGGVPPSFRSSWPQLDVMVMALSVAHLLTPAPNRLDLVIMDPLQPTRSGQSGGARKWSSDKHSSPIAETGKEVLMMNIYSRVCYE